MDSIDTIRAAARTWGSTAHERQLEFACDRCVAEPNDALYRAVTVEAPGHLALVPTARKPALVSDWFNYPRYVAFRTCIIWAVSHLSGRTVRIGFVEAVA